MQIMCSSTQGCRLGDHHMERIPYAEVLRLKAAGVNVFMDAVRCYAYPGIWHVRGRTIRS